MRIASTDGACLAAALFFGGFVGKCLDDFTALGVDAFSVRGWGCHRFGRLVVSVRHRYSESSELDDDADVAAVEMIGSDEASAVGIVDERHEHLAGKVVPATQR